MEFLIVRPRRLTPWVEEIWYSQGRLEERHERVLPSTWTDIVANLGAPMRHVRGARDVAPIIGTTITGLLTRPMLLEHPEIHEAVGIRLTARGLRAVLGVPPGAVRDAVVDLTDVLPSRVDVLAETCLEAAPGGPRAMLAAAVAWLEGRIAAEHESDPIVAWAVERIDAAHGACAVGVLQRESGYGATRFNQRFTDELGVTPKMYARLARFSAALDQLPEASSLAELAAELGYSDQAHMNRDFRTLGGTTPGEVLERRYPSGVTLAGE